MILDLHTHSIKSDDGRAKVENYCQWIRARELPIDGIVLTEHRQFDFESDYSALAKANDLVILKASEVETEYGHVLVYGVTEALTQAFDFASINNVLEDVIQAARDVEADAPAPPEEPFEHVPIDPPPPAPPRSDGTHPLDAASSPLIRALPDYERQFRHHRQSAAAVWRATQARFEECRRLVTEMHVQALAIDSAREIGRASCRERV